MGELKNGGHTHWLGFRLWALGHFDQPPQQIDIEMLDPLGMTLCGIVHIIGGKLGYFLDGVNQLGKRGGVALGRRGSGLVRRNQGYGGAC